MIFQITDRQDTKKKIKLFFSCVVCAYTSRSGDSLDASWLLSFGLSEVWRLLRLLEHTADSNASGRNTRSTYNNLDIFLLFLFSISSFLFSSFSFSFHLKTHRKKKETRKKKKGRYNYESFLFSVYLLGAAAETHTDVKRQQKAVCIGGGSVSLPPPHVYFTWLVVFRWRMRDTHKQRKKKDEALTWKRKKKKSLG